MIWDWIEKFLDRERRITLYEMDHERLSDTTARIRRRRHRMEDEGSTDIETMHWLFEAEQLLYEVNHHFTFEHGDSYLKSEIGRDPFDMPLMRRS